MKTKKTKFLRYKRQADRPAVFCFYLFVIHPERQTPLHTVFHGNDLQAAFKDLRRSFVRIREIYPFSARILNGGFPDQSKHFAPLVKRGNLLFAPPLLFRTNFKLVLQDRYYGNF